MIVSNKCKRCGEYFLTNYEDQKYCTKKCRIEARIEKSLEQGQICWICKNAAGKCSWSKCLQPVEGWIAEPNEIKDDEGNFRSYKIIFCPQFMEGRV